MNNIQYAKKMPFIGHLFKASRHNFSFQIFLSKVIAVLLIFLKS